jgi:peptidoglycan/LPS O-acetylase OafA/YrhL
MSDQGRLHELDSLRGLAAIGVIGWHYTNHFHASPLPHLMAPFYRHGLLLVDFFFVLSGFVLARTYWTDKRSADVAGNLKDRIARLYPLHLATLCVVAVLQWLLMNQLHSEPFVYAFNDGREFVLNLLLLNRTGLERGFSFNAPSWSISTEFIVNVAFLLAITARRVIAAALIAVGFATATAVALRNGLISNATVLGIDNDVFRAALGFCVGAALFHLGSAIDRVRIPKMVHDLLALAAIAWLLHYCAGPQVTRHMDLAMVLTCFPVLIASATRGALVKRLLRLPLLVFLGAISYSIYLVHFPLQLAAHVFEVASKTSIPYGSPYALLGFLLVTIAVSWVTYRTIELPGKTAMKKLLGSRKPAIAVQGT